jgi:hypothetical protein
MAKIECETDGESFFTHLDVCCGLNEQLQQQLQTSWTSLIGGGQSLLASVLAFDQYSRIRGKEKAGLGSR